MRAQANPVRSLPAEQCTRNPPSSSASRALEHPGVVLRVVACEVAVDGDHKVDALLQAEGAALALGAHVHGVAGVDRDLQTLRGVGRKRRRVLVALRVAPEVADESHVEFEEPPAPLGLEPGQQPGAEEQAVADAAPVARGVAAEVAQVHRAGEGDSSR